MNSERIYARVLIYGIGVPGDNLKKFISKSNELTPLTKISLCGGIKPLMQFSYANGIEIGSISDETKTFLFSKDEYIKKLKVAFMRHEHYLQLIEIDFETNKKTFSENFDNSASTEIFIIPEGKTLLFLDTLIYESYMTGLVAYYTDIESVKYYQLCSMEDEKYSISTIWFEKKQDDVLKLKIPFYLINELDVIGGVLNEKSLESSLFRITDVITPGGKSIFHDQVLKTRLTLDFNSKKFIFEHAEKGIWNVCVEADSKQFLQGKLKLLAFSSDVSMAELQKSMPFFPCVFPGTDFESYFATPLREIEFMMQKVTDLYIIKKDSTPQNDIGKIALLSNLDLNALGDGSVLTDVAYEAAKKNSFKCITSLSSTTIVVGTVIIVVLAIGIGIYTYHKYLSNYRKKNSWNTPDTPGDYQMDKNQALHFSKFMINQLNRLKEQILLLDKAKLKLISIDPLSSSKAKSIALKALNNYNPKTIVEKINKILDEKYGEMRPLLMKDSVSDEVNRARAFMERIKGIAIPFSFKRTDEVIGSTNATVLHKKIAIRFSDSGLARADPGTKVITFNLKELVNLSINDDYDASCEFPYSRENPTIPSVVTAVHEISHMRVLSFLPQSMFLHMWISEGIAQAISGHSELFGRSPKEILQLMTNKLYNGNISQDYYFQSLLLLIRICQSPVTHKYLQDYIQVLLGLSCTTAGVLTPTSKNLYNAAIAKLETVADTLINTCTTAYNNPQTNIPDFLNKTLNINATLKAYNPVIFSQRDKASIETFKTVFKNYGPRMITGSVEKYVYNSIEYEIHWIFERDSTDKYYNYDIFQPEHREPSKVILYDNDMISGKWNRHLTSTTSTFPLPTPPHNKFPYNYMPLFMEGFNKIYSTNKAFGNTDLWENINFDGNSNVDHILDKVDCQIKRWENFYDDLPVGSIKRKLFTFLSADEENLENAIKNYDVSAASPYIEYPIFNCDSVFYTTKNEPVDFVVKSLMGDIPKLIDGDIKVINKKKDDSQENVECSFYERNICGKRRLCFSIPPTREDTAVISIPKLTLQFSLILIDLDQINLNMSSISNAVKNKGTPDLSNLILNLIPDKIKIEDLSVQYNDSSTFEDALNDLFWQGIIYKRNENQNVTTNLIFRLTLNVLNTEEIIYVERSMKIESISSTECFIATTVYGNINAPNVIALRAYRDRILRNSILGRLFIRVYYRFGPYFAKKLKNKNRIKAWISILLDKMVRRFKRKGYIE